jgi:putative tryptophan/tyrosine transport system substrate-binding protein
MRRRDFNVLLAGSLAWPLSGCGESAAAQEIGFLNSASPKPFAQLLAAFCEGLKEQGYEAPQNLRMEERWAEGDENRLKEMALELVERRVALIVATGGIRSAQLAKGATAAIPILFISGADPVDRGLVKSIPRPGGNATGMSVDTTETVPKRLEILRKLVFSGTKIAMLVSPGTIAPGPGHTVPEREKKFAEENGLLAIQPRNMPDFDEELTDKIDMAVRDGVQALVVSGDPFYFNKRFLLAKLAARHALPAVYSGRDYVDAGGLISYAPSFHEVYRRIGVYAGRILHGARPQDLPVMFPQKWDLVINVKTAKALGLAVPWRMTAIATEIID